MKRRNVNYRLSLVLLLVFTAGGFFRVSAQQEALYSQYMFNPFIINPGYAGSRDALSGVMLFRKQWVGMPGAPATATFSIHNPFHDGKMAAGFSAYSDATGPSSNLGVMATYAYNVRLGAGKLSFGLRAGLLSSKMDGTKLDYYNPADHFNTQSVATATAPSFDFGLYYYTRKYYVGFSALHLTGESLKYVTSTGEINQLLKRHYMFMAGLATELSSSVVLKPSLLVKYVDGAPVSADVNLSMLFNKIFWVGVSYRNLSSVNVITEFNITDYLRIGYSYEVPVTRLKKFTSGTHEIFAGFDLTLGKSKHVSPRYL